MSYVYAEQRDSLFTDRGQRMLLAVRDTVQRLLAEAGAFRAQEAWRGVTGCSWMMLACLDRLEELDEIEKANVGGVAQHAIYRATRRMD